MDTVIRDVGGPRRELLAGLDLSVTVWRANAIEQLWGRPQHPAVRLAPKPENDIHAHRALLRADPTVVIGMGLAPRSRSLAMTLGPAGDVRDATGYDGTHGAPERQVHQAAERARQVN